MRESANPPVTLIHLLSMSKLQKGREQARTQFWKRWQTPQDVYDQTMEAKKLFRENGRSIDQVVFLYTNSLYYNSNEPAITLHEKYNNAVSIHKNGAKKIFGTRCDFSVILWDELIQAQSNVEQSRALLKKAYERHSEFRENVQMGNTKRTNTITNMCNELLPSDMFVLEETGILGKLARGYIRHDKIKKENDLAILYPGEPLRSLQYILAENTNIRLLQESVPERPSHTIETAIRAKTVPKPACAAIDASIIGEPKVIPLCTPKNRSKLKF